MLQDHGSPSVLTIALEPGPWLPSSTQKTLLMKAMEDIYPIV